MERDFSASRTGRPASLRQRAARFGTEQLDTGELLALVLGRAGADVGCAAPADLGALSRARPGELQVLLGLPPAAAARLAAAFDLGRRVQRAGRGARVELRNPESVRRLLAPEVCGREREAFFALLLDGKHRLRRVELVSEGTLTSSLVHPREFFRAAVREAAAAVIAAHNHPSGDPEPSAEDLEVTRRLADAGALLGIPLLDHVVLGDPGCVSLRERMQLGRSGAG